MKRIINDVLDLAALVRPTWGDISAAIERTGTPTAHVAEGSLKDKLKRIESALADERDRKVELLAEREAAKVAYAGIEGLSPDSDEFKEAQEAVKAVGECEDRIAALTQEQIGLLQMLGRDAGDPGQTRPAGDPTDPRLQGWDSNKLFASDDTREFLEKHATSKGHMGNVELGQVIGRDAFAAASGSQEEGTDAMRRAAYLGVVPQLRRILRVINLIPTATMDNNILPYTVESGSFTTAKVAKEGETKPLAAITFTDAEAVAQTIAHYLKLRKQSLSDYSALRGICDSRLRYGVERKLEEEVLTGKAGAGTELSGILHTTGLGVIKYNATASGEKTTVAGGTYVAEQVLRAITTIFLADAIADGMVMHPTDWQTALISKSTYVASAGVTGGSGEFVGGGPFQITPTQLWGVPLVPSASMKENEVLVGDFSIGCQLFIREGVNVLLSDSDQDDFVKNRVTMLAEMRAALAVFRPAAFAKVWLTETGELAGN